MKGEDLPAFTAELLLTAELFGAQLSEARIGAYFEALGDQSIRGVLMALRACRERKRFFPLPGDVRELLEEDSESAAAYAFALLMANLGDRATPEAKAEWHANEIMRVVVARMGGVAAFRARTFGHSTWRVFLRLYQAELRDHRMRSVMALARMTERQAISADGGDGTEHR